MAIRMHPKSKAKYLRMGVHENRPDQRMNHYMDDYCNEGKEVAIFLDDHFIKFTTIQATAYRQGTRLTKVDGAWFDNMSYDKDGREFWSLAPGDKELIIEEEALVVKRDDNGEEYWVSTIY